MPLNSRPLLNKVACEKNEPLALKTWPSGLNRQNCFATFSTISLVGIPRTVPTCGISSYCWKTGGGPLIRFHFKLTFTSTRLATLMKGMAEKHLCWKAHALPLRPLSRMANPCFYVASDQKKHSQLFLREDPGRWAQTTYVQRS